MDVERDFVQQAPLATLRSSKEVGPLMWWSNKRRK